MLIVFFLLSFPFDVVTPLSLADSGTRSIFEAIVDDNQYIMEVGDDYKVKYFDILDLKIKFEVSDFKYLSTWTQRSDLMAHCLCTMSCCSRFGTRTNRCGRAELQMVISLMREGC